MAAKTELQKMEALHELAQAKADEASGFGPMVEASLYQQMLDIIRTAPPEPAFPYDLLNDIIDIVCECGRITTALMLVQVSPQTFAVLLQDARDGDEVAMEAVKAIGTAKAAFESGLITKMMKNPNTALGKMIEHILPHDWVPQDPGVGKHAESARNQIAIFMPSNNRDEVEVEDVTKKKRQKAQAIDVG